MGAAGLEFVGREEIRAWVRGSRAVLEEGTMMPRRRGLGGISLVVVLLRLLVWTTERLCRWVFEE